VFGGNVKVEYTVISTFSAAAVEDGRLSGHNYVVEATQVEANADIKHALASLVVELDGRQLEDMMPGADTSAAGVAAWLMERLALRFPRLVRVSVQSTGTERVAVLRDPTR
jgi:hypothetical protein